MYCKENAGTPSSLSSVSSSVVLGLEEPPSNSSPSSLSQLQCQNLPCAKEWLGTHTPEEKEMQLVEVESPPQRVREEMVW